MRWARSEPGARGARPGWPVVLLAALLGAGVGVAVPRPAQTGAVFVDDTTVTGTFEVRPCSNAWLEAVTPRAPTRHYDFASTSAIPGNTPSPGLLVCNPSGARKLSGVVGESVTDPVGGTMTVAPANSLVLWVSITDATPGDLLWLTQDGGAIGLRVSGGLLELVQAPPLDVDPIVVLAAVAAPAGGPHMLTLTRSAGSLRLWVDSSEVATASTSLPEDDARTLRLGALRGDASSASAVLDEVVVLPAALDAANIASLVATNIW